MSLITMENIDCSSFGQGVTEVGAVQLQDILSCHGVVPPACCIERVLRSGTAWVWRCVAETSLRLGGHPGRYSTCISTEHVSVGLPL